VQCNDRIILYITIGKGLSALRNHFRQIS
jgi:hypothetical protein